MKRWDQRNGFEPKTEDPAVEAFMEEIVAVCKKHGLVLGHEDTHGSFLVETYDEEILEWLKDAAISPNYHGPRAPK